MTDYKTAANDLAHELQEACIQDIGEPFHCEKVHRVASRALALLRQVGSTLVNPDYRADHDSLFVKFEQLEGLVDRLGDADTLATQHDVRELVGLIRRQVLK